jgi:hypothetical protein
MIEFLMKRFLMIVLSVALFSSLFLMLRTGREFTGRFLSRGCQDSPEEKRGNPLDPYSKQG